MMKKKGVFIMFLCLCLSNILFGCATSKNITNEKLIEFFEHNENDFSAVANILYPLGYDDLTFHFIDNKIVETYNNGNSEFALSNEEKNVLLNCLQKMDEFLKINYNNSSFSTRITTRKIFGETLILEFDFRNEKNNVDCGIVYSIEQMDENFIKLKNNWYLYFYGLV